ncbi:MAG TPA: hypothetical protein VFV87_07580 [Pirellulaceae bacterium]|nr:hypothetical protein [Pirellulaceae bacterium]
MKAQTAIFGDALDFLRRVEDPKRAKMNRREIYSPQKVAAMRKRYPGVPSDYLAYLREVGAGTFRECQFMVYGFLATPDEILGEGVFDWLDAKTRVLCFGDDFSGDMSGFLPDEGWQIVELWHDSGRVRHQNQSFGKYIRAQMLMGPNGDDLRSKS